MRHRRSVALMLPSHTTHSIPRACLRSLPTFPCQADVITLELDVVHQPHTISEFEPHAKQTLQVDDAHYHFDTAPGVKVDAQALLRSLEASNFAVDGALGCGTHAHQPHKADTCSASTGKPHVAPALGVNGHEQLVRAVPSLSCDAILTY